MSDPRAQQAAEKLKTAKKWLCYTREYSPNSPHELSRQAAFARIKKDVDDVIQFLLSIERYSENPTENEKVNY